MWTSHVDMVLRMLSARRIALLSVAVAAVILLVMNSYHWNTYRLYDAAKQLLWRPAQPQFCRSNSILGAPDLVRATSPATNVVIASDIDGDTLGGSLASFECSTGRLVSALRAEQLNRTTWFAEPACATTNATVMLIHREGHYRHIYHAMAEANAIYRMLKLAGFVGPIDTPRRGSVQVAFVNGDSRFLPTIERTLAAISGHPVVYIQENPSNTQPDDHLSYGALVSELHVRQPGQIVAVVEPVRASRALESIPHALYLVATFAQVVLCL